MSVFAAAIWIASTLFLLLFIYNSGKINHKYDEDMDKFLNQLNAENETPTENPIPVAPVIPVIDEPIVQPSDPIPGI